MQKTSTRLFTSHVDTPIGGLFVEASAEAVTRVSWSLPGRTPDPVESLPEHLRAACIQLVEFAAGNRMTFDLPLAPSGTSFRRAVWSIMREIPYGETRTYGDIARQLRSSARAVGQACGDNPIPIIIPCHRVVGQGGRMTGFSGGEGVKTKQILLSLEGFCEPDAIDNLPLFQRTNEQSATSP